MENQKTFMNVKTGAVGGFEIFEYADANGEIQDALFNGEIVEATKVNSGKWMPVFSENLNKYDGSDLGIDNDSI